MTGFLLLLILCLCTAQSISIYRMKKQEKNWLTILRGIRNGEQDKIFVNGTGRMADISYEINRIIEENQVRLEQLKKADDANRQILTGLSHDVRTPLASLLGYLEALERGVSDRAEQQEYISVALRKAKDLKAYVDMLFEWFKLGSREEKFSFETVDIKELTREILIEWIPVLEQENIALIADIGDDELPVSLDTMAYSRILGNLVQNAVRHGACTKIWVAVKHNPDTVSISVMNNGEMIPPEQLPHIFERLFKGDHARSSKGSGLGLAITKELVCILHGKISAASSQAEGTSFLIELPVSK